MADVIFVAIVIAFFVLCVFFVKACDRVIGPDLAEETLTEASDVSEVKS